jgi:hypothetical protein
VIAYSEPNQCVFCVETQTVLVTGSKVSLSGMLVSHDGQLWRFDGNGFTPEPEQSEDE